MSGRTTRGGARPGAGRPTGTTKPNRRASALAVRLSDAERAKAERIGDGNASRGVRIALDEFNGLLFCSGCGYAISESMKNAVSVDLKCPQCGVCGLSEFVRRPPQEDER